MNYSHLFPTRYALELEGLKGTVGSETFKEVSQREDSKKQIKKLLEDRYTSGKNKWFFQPLRVRNPFLALPLTSRPPILYHSVYRSIFMHRRWLLTYPLTVLICLGSAFVLLRCSQNRYMYITCPRMTHATTTSCLNSNMPWVTTLLLPSVSH